MRKSWDYLCPSSRFRKECINLSKITLGTYLALIARFICRETLTTHLLWLIEYPVIAENMQKKLQINFATKLLGSTIFFIYKWKGVLSDHCTNGYLLTPNHRPKSNSGTIVLNPRWDIWSTRSTVLTHKIIFYNICEDLNFVSLGSNHIIWYLSVQVGNLGKDCHQPILFNELHKSVHEKTLGLRSHSR